jgi:hypothetical protein
MISPGKKRLQPRRKLRYWCVWLTLCAILYADLLPTPVAYGGCPWTKASEVTVSPSTPCLELSVIQGARGCIDPELDGQNKCTETFTLRGHEFAPGDSISVLVSLDSGTSHQDHGIVDRYDFQLSAKLGARDISISFYTYLEHWDPFGTAFLPVLGFLAMLCLGAILLVPRHRGFDESALLW